MPSFKIEPFDADRASDALWDRYFSFNDALHWEITPDPEDTPMSHKVTRAFMQDPGPQVDPQRWIAWNEDKTKIIGYCQISFATPQAPAYQSNKHIANLNLRVVQERRRQGIGTKLLKAALNQAKTRSITTVQADTNHEVGHAVCEYFGGKVAIEGAENRLKLADVDWDMIQRWAEEGPKRAPGVTIEDFVDVPEADLEAYVKLYTETMNQQPMGEMEGEMITTPQSRRENEQRMKAKGVNWLTKITREPDGNISGLTEIVQAVAEPRKVFQNLTGVRATYRGRGLGKWLKAEMLLHIRKTYPDAQHIATGNADVNAPMLSINKRMGFKRHLSGTVYKFSLAALCQKLGL